MTPSAAGPRPETRGKLGPRGGRFRGVLVCAAALLLAAAGPLRAAWDIVTIGDREYVTLESFCKFYGFPYKAPGEKDEQFKASNGTDEINLHVNSRIMYLDGYRHWLSFGTLKPEDKKLYPDGGAPWLISKTDVIKTLEPLLRPHLIKDRRPVKGIVLDPGHGGSDAGAVNSRGQREKQLTLEMAFRIEKILKAKGINVVLTRRSDSFLDLSDRSGRSNRYKDYAFVSLHFNSASSNAYGPETFASSPMGTSSSNGGSEVKRSDYQRQANNEQDACNVLLAHELQTRLAALYPGDDEADRGVKRARFVVLRKNKNPAALIEFGFLSNSREAKLIGSSSHRQKMAEAVANGLLAYIAKMEPQPEKRLPSPTVRGPAITTSAPPVPPAPPLRVVPKASDKGPDETDRKLQAEQATPAQKAAEVESPAKSAGESGSSGEIIIYGQ